MANHDNNCHIYQIHGMLWLTYNITSCCRWGFSKGPQGPDWATQQMEKKMETATASRWQCRKSWHSHGTCLALWCNECISWTLHFKLKKWAFGFDFFFWYILQNVMDLILWGRLSLFYEDNELQICLYLWEAFNNLLNHLFCLRKYWWEFKCFEHGILSRDVSQCHCLCLSVQGGCSLNWKWL